MTEYDRQDIADKITDSLDKLPAKTCPVFDPATIDGIQAIAKMYNSGKRAMGGFIITIIILGLCILLLTGLLEKIKMITK